MFKQVFDESGAGGGSASAQPADDQAKEGETPNFDSWLASQDESVKGLLESHTKGLKSALDAERESRKIFEKQIKELAGKAEEGSEAKKNLVALSEQVTAENQRAAFYEKAHELGVKDLKAAYILAHSEQMFSKEGEFDVNAFKTRFPYLMEKTIPQGNAGEGSQSQTPAQSMNDLIRQKAGVK